MNAIRNLMCIRTAVLVGCLFGLAAQSGGGQAWVQVKDIRWVNMGGADTVSGTVEGAFEYAVSFDPTGGSEIAGPGISFSPAPGSELTWVETEEESYLWATPTGATWQPVGETISDYQAIWAGRTPGYTSFDLGMTVTRTVSDPVVTAADANMTVAFDVRLDAPLPAGTNFFNVGLNQWGLDGFSYDILGGSKPDEFEFSSDTWLFADPDDLIVGDMYHFEINLRVVPDDAFAGGPIYHKPGAMVSYGRDEYIGPVDANEVTLTLSSGAQATFSASETTTFSGRRVHQQTDVIFEAVADSVGPADPNEIMLVRGRETFGGQPLHTFYLEVVGQNIAGVELTTPTNKTVLLENEDHGEWSYEIEATDPNALADFGSGTYTLEFFSTDDSNSVVTQVVLADVPLPSEFPTITSPTGDTRDNTPTINWGAPTDGNINTIVVGIEQEDWYNEAFVDPNVTSMTFGSPVSLGFAGAYVIFANGDSGQTAQGIDYLTAMYAGANDYFNILPPVPGDVNGDGNVDNIDITAFVAALTNNEGEFAALYPDWVYLGADADGDGNVDNIDILPFVNLLTGGGQVPEPATMMLLAAGSLAVLRRRRSLVTRSTSCCEGRNR